MNLSTADASGLLARIKQDIQLRAKHPLITLTTRGDAAIKAALSLLPQDKTLLIPEEGGWLSYLRIPREKKIPVMAVHCHDAKIDLSDLQEKLKSNPCSALLYQNPGGYFAEQPMKEIYQLCQQYHCRVIIDVSGAIGTALCDGDFADIFVCSFGEWKLVEAGKGGFISCKDEKIDASLSLNDLIDPAVLASIAASLQLLDQKIDFLLEKRKIILRDLQNYQIIHRDDLGFVIIIAFSTSEEKEKIINYCHQNELEWTECPRYIRVQRPAISIELKRLRKS